MEKFTKTLVLILVILNLAGCKSFNIEDLPFVEDRFHVDNVGAGAQEDRKAVSSPGDENFELKFYNASAGDLCDLFRLKTSYSLVCKVPDDFSFSGFFCGSAGKILHDIAISNGLNFARIGNTYYLYSQEFSSLDVSAAIVCPGLPDDVLSRVFPGVYYRIGNKLILSGKMQDVLKFQTFVDDFKDAVKSNYVVTIVQVETSSELAYNLQMQITSKGIDLLQPNVSAWDVFSAAARISGSSLDFDSYHERQFFVTDGQKMTYNQTTDKKVENRAVSDQGTSTVTGYTDIEAGAIVDLTLQAFLNDVISCSYNIELSNFVADSLDKNVTSVSSEDVLFALGKIYYLASTQDKVNSNSFNVLGLGKNDSNAVTSIYVKIDKIAGF